MDARKTPVMAQHAKAKQAYPDAVLFFRLGDFYEMFGDDAVLVARLLDLTLTSRNKGKPDEVPMAGVPHHAAHGYIAKLLELGHKVAICEQMADPSKVKGIVPREVVRVITPGLVTDGDKLEAGSNNWLVTLELAPSGVGVALLDLSTGELFASAVADLGAVLGELSRAAPREVLIGADGATAADVRESAAAAVRVLLPRAAVRNDETLEPEQSGQWLGVLEAEAKVLSAPARQAVARALRFARVCNPSSELPVRRIAHFSTEDVLVIDRVAQAHLELVVSNSGAREATLLGVIDRTRTPMGARLLRRRLLAPLAEVERIRRRLDQVELFVVHARLRQDLSACLARVSDLERLAVRAAMGEATPRDLGALRDGLGAAKDGVAICEAIEDKALAETLGLDGTPVNTEEALYGELERALVERPPAQPREASVFRPGYDSELDEYESLRKTGTERMAELEAELRQQTGIGTLKVRYTRVFGWYVEVSRGQAGRAPAGWQRKQTVATGERYTTPELDEWAQKIESAEERHRERELFLLKQLVTTAAERSEGIRDLAQRIAKWDVSLGLAEVAHRYDYARPEVSDSDILEIEDGRHPVVERLAAAGRFVPNDVALDLKRERLWLITGPNMAGKSTLLRQTALIVILAQMGAYVPARAARIGLVDRVLSRVGASDNLARGESTFMVEMRETAEILRSASRRSFLILDEIGRGTSTFDGLAIAWAIAEYIDEVVGCRALFATHYHELTALADASEHAQNYSVSAREQDQDVVFLHRLVKGASSRSYGIAVAKLAGLPESVLARARGVLASLESGTFAAAPGQKRTSVGAGAGEGQLDLFAPAAPPTSQSDIIDTIRDLDVNRLTPLEALKLLSRLQKKTRGVSS